LKVTKDGQSATPDPLWREDPTRVYCAWGIRNSFGLISIL
jgi:hypothetical protein